MIRNIQKLDLTFKGLYDSSFIVHESEWDFFNDPFSEKFQILEYTIGVYRLKHKEFLKHFQKLKELSSQLLEEVRKELETR